MLIFLLTPPNSGTKIHGGDLRSVKTISGFIFSFGASFSWFQFILFTLSSDTRDVMCHIDARLCTRFPTTLTNPFLLTNPHLNHELHQEVARPGLTYLTYRWGAKQGKGKTGHRQRKRLCMRVYVLITRSHL